MECRTTSEFFNLGLAYELYGALIGPVEGLIRDKKHLIVAPSGALTALPQTRDWFMPRCTEQSMMIGH